MDSDEEMDDEEKSSRKEVCTIDASWIGRDEEDEEQES